MIGVTGHRKLENAAALAARVRQTLERIAGLMEAEFPHTSAIFNVLSPLAEGADRLVAGEVLKTSRAELEVALPLEKNDYMNDFKASESKAEFERFLGQATHVKTLARAGPRPQAYAAVGRYVVDNCDVLIALWNGQPAAGAGGTAEIVAYAREKRRPLFRIDVNAPEHEAAYEPGSGLHLHAFHDLEEYNVEPVQPDEVLQEIRRLKEAAARVQFPAEALLPTAEAILPNYVRADRLALRYQKWYLRAGSGVYYLAAAAVCVAAFQALFFPDLPRIVALEVALMAVVLVLLLVGRRLHWHEKWMDYRFLAECFRSALFLALADVQVERLRPPPHLSLAYSTKDWIVSALLHAWRGLPRRGADNVPWEKLRELLAEAWVRDQVGYHNSASKRNYRRHRRRAALGVALFSLTLILALLHVFDFGAVLNRWMEMGLGDQILSFFAIALPAFGGAIGAIRTHREYLKNARRSEEMARYLQELQDQMLAARSAEEFRKVVRDVEEAMLHENQDWRVIVRFHELEPPA